MILNVFQTYFLPAIVLAGTELLGGLIGVFKILQSKLTRLSQLIEMLPGYNCGACGYRLCLCEGLSKG